jgi:hypothetical protein
VVCNRSKSTLKGVAGGCCTATEGRQEEEDRGLGGGAVAGLKVGGWAIQQ